VHSFYGIYQRSTATNAAHFLDKLMERMSFPLKAIQVDGGSEFEAIFEEECKRRGIRLFVLPPRFPKLNGGVERSHREGNVGQAEKLGGDMIPYRFV